MNTRTQEVAQFNSEQLVASVVIVHEASRNRETLSDLPKHLVTALGAAAVSMVMISLDEKRAETGRVNFNSTTFSISGSDEEDWTMPLVAESTAGPALTDVIQFTPGSEVHAVFAVDAGTLVAFRVQTPAALYTITDGGQAMLSSILEQVAANIRRHAHRATSKVREKPLLRTLTRAEWRVLNALDSDMPEKQIATELNTTGNTLHSHIKSIYRRLGVQSRLSAIALLRRAERDVLCEEMQAARNSNPANGAGNANWDGHSLPSPSTITITPSAESLHRSVSFIPFTGGDLRVG